MNWQKDNANFLVLVGDAGNEKPDAKGRMIDAIAKKMAEKEINFIAFQANHPDNVAYHDFCSQIMELMVKEMNQMWNSKIKRKDFKDAEHRLKEVRSNNRIVITSAAYHYAEINSNESASYLKNLVERKINEFKDQSLETKEQFQREINKLIEHGLGQNVDKSDRVGEFENIEEFLKERGFTEADIAALKKKNVILKII